ncbi:MAG: 50S ribosomal protein L10 [Rubricoccaceae bacterium]|nr:50S ribosomal protein L10 [Rubricoccaceae bacterium]
MPLTIEQKKAQVDAIAAQLDAHNTVYLTDHIGLTVDEVNKLRRAFRDADVKFKVYKNTMIRRAMEAKGGFEELYEQLSGPTAIAFTNDPAGPAKVIRKFLEEFDKELPRFKGAYVDGAIFDDSQLTTLSSLKSRDELLADILGLLMAPLTNVVGGLDAQGSNLVGAIKSIADKAEA